MATRCAAIPVLQDGAIAAADVISLATEITRMATRTEGSILRLVWVRNEV